MIKKTFAGLFTFLIAGLAFAAHGTVLFEDNFSSGAQSSQNWSISNPFIAAAFTGGACAVTNSSDSFSGYYFHEFTVKPAVFTASAKITRSSDSIICGFALGFNSENMGSIAVFLGNGALYMGTPGKDVQGIPCPYVADEQNVLAVSMSGSDCNIFVNNQFVQAVKDVNTPGKNFAFIVSAKSTVTFDDLVITDVFTQGSERTAFSDDFGSGSLKVDWSINSANAGIVSVGEGVLNLKTSAAGTYVIMNADVKMTDFIMSAEFKHKSGIGTSYYGLRLDGDTIGKQAIFVITAGRTYGAAVGTQSFNLSSSQKIRGAAYDDGTGNLTFFVDTLKVVKLSGSSSYDFYVNGNLLTSLPGIDFSVAAAGLVCMDSLNIDVDNFYAGVDPTPVKHPYMTKRNNSSLRYAVYRGSMAADPMGRSVNVNRLINGKVSSGIYMTRGMQMGSSAVILKK